MDVAVVGSGPNGLAAAVVLARAGLVVHVYEAAVQVGGGLRTAEPVLPGYRHDLCSAVHPMALASPFFQAFDLAAHGVRMVAPEAAYAHPLDGGRAGVAWQDLERTADGLGVDRAAWRRLFEPLVAHWQQVAALGLSDLRSSPPASRVAARFGWRALWQASALDGLRFRDPIAPAMLAGVAAHAIRPPRGPAAVGAGLLLATLAHAVGWPLPRGGSQCIADVLAADVTANGGKIMTGCRVDDLRELAPARAVLLDTSPAECARIAGLGAARPVRPGAAAVPARGGGLHGELCPGRAGAVDRSRLPVGGHAAPRR